MHGRMRASARLRSALLAATAGVLFLVVPALAATTDMNDFNLTETTTTWPSQFHVSTGGSLIQYRWLDSPNKSTVISSNACSDLSLLGAPASYGVGDTDYHNLGSSPQGSCFVVRGRTAAGSGSMSLHDGRVNR
jgi:hypothetical protein